MCPANLPESHVRRKIILHIDTCWAVQKSTQTRSASSVEPFLQ